MFGATVFMRRVQGREHTRPLYVASHSIGPSTKKQVAAGHLRLSLPGVSWSGFHEPVLLEEILAQAADTPGLSADSGGRLILDGTLGDGGHSQALLKRFPGARLIGCDQDLVMLGRARERLGAAVGADAVVGPVDPAEAPCGDSGDMRQVTLWHCNFREAPAHLAARGLHPNFILLDLGVSMFHFRGAARGFSYTDSGPLDMRLNPDRGGATAADLLNHTDRAELQRIFQVYGEERFAGRIARAIVENRPLATAAELADLILDSVPGPKSHPKSAGKSGANRNSSGGAGGHPATRVFQALRIAVNDELGAAESALGAGQTGFAQQLAPGGRLAVISFHSLEDRVVKTAFKAVGVPVHQRRAADAEYRILTKKPLPPSDAEIERNPAARSAKLRVLERSADTPGRP